MAPGRAFTPELTPTWLATAALLHGQRPPDLAAGLRCAYVGGPPATAAVVAAVHPGAEVWTWDPRPGAVEARRLLRHAADLPGLHVHERPDLDGMAPGPLDLVVVDGVVDTDPALADEVMGLVARALRPGGLLGVAYRTTVGWSEVVPVARLLRHLVAADPRPPVEAVPDALAVLARLGGDDAGYVPARPAASGWVDGLLAADVAEVVADHVEQGLAPLSAAGLAARLGPTGCTFVGSARLDDPLVDLLPAAAAAVPPSAGPATREALADLALGRTDRVDLFRLGTAPLSPRERRARVAAVVVTGLDPAERRSPHRAAAPAAGPDPDPGGLDGPVPVAALARDLGHRSPPVLLARLLTGGHAHPVVPGRLDPAAVDGARRLNAVLGAGPGAPLLAVARAGTAVAADAALPPARRAQLGLA